ncbi:alpha/beta-hydrolase [Obba rivulosa]|uniref:Alpha/beta-hydrolase n=1 Tax=Obba rivulosa TaxID=1052685 RepID=A0A8E2DRX5_9APHY|nr:alpha/beta-hydrolase [Obba rivulosa]
MASSYPQPPNAPQATPTCHPRPLVPLDAPPPLPDPLPALPSPPRTSLLDASYALTTHLVPAAAPRSTPDVPLPPLPQWTPDRARRAADVRQTAEALLDVRQKQWRGELPGERSRTLLWVCLNRYVRRGLRDGGGKGITLFVAHANGFPKEIWEPALLRLVEAQRGAGAAYDIDEIWTWEAVNHGDACLVNARRLCGIYDWQDNTRDILHFLLHYLPSSASPAVLPTHLPRLPDSVAQSRIRRGFADRTVVGIGHSFGGCTTAYAAITYPQLFSSLILVDPIIFPHESAGTLDPRSGVPDSVGRHHNVTGAIQRRDRWASREEALRLFSAISFFAAWDPAVLELYVECALCDDPDGGVRLKMPGIQEAVVFSEMLTKHEVWELLPALDERIELRWIIPRQLPSRIFDIRTRMIWRRPANSSNIIIENSGHLIAQEAPGELAQDIHSFLQRKYGAPPARL